MNFFHSFYIPSSLPIPHHSYLERGRPPLGVNKACHITLRQNQAPSPALRLGDTSLVPKAHQGQVLIPLLEAPQTDQATQLERPFLQFSP